MSHLENCQVCGARLGDAGCCSACGGNSRLSTVSIAEGILSKIRHLLGPAARLKRRLLYGRAILIDRQSGKSVCLDRTVTSIGRATTNNLVVLGDPAVSRLHAVISFAKGSYVIEDLGSSNGTYINGNRLFGKREIFAEDLLTFGKSDFLVEAAATDLPTSIGRWDVMSELGRGGMGVVYKAIDRRTNEVVAIKQFLEAEGASRRQKHRAERFKREATIAAQLKHANIVSVLDVHLGKDSLYYVMELVEGHNLREEAKSRGGRMPAADYCVFLLQIASALSHAHAHNVIHRDVKPENILVSNGTIKLFDFGIARVEDLDQANLTRSGALLGTLAYISPEQLDNPKKVDVRSDIYSLGVVSYEMLAGVCPFQGEGITGVVTQISAGDQKPLNQLVAGLTPDIADVVAKAMNRNAAERYSSVAEFAQQFAASVSD